MEFRNPLYAPHLHQHVSTRNCLHTSKFRSLKGFIYDQDSLPHNPKYEELGNDYIIFPMVLFELVLYLFLCLISREGDDLYCCPLLVILTRCCFQSLVWEDWICGLVITFAGIRPCSLRCVFSCPQVFLTSFFFLTFRLIPGFDRLLIIQIFILCAY